MKSIFFIILALLQGISQHEVCAGVLLEQGKYLHALFPIDPIENEIQARRINMLPAPFLVTKLMVTSNMTMVNDDYVMEAPTKVCSGYDRTVCHAVGQFYESSGAPLFASGLIFLNRDEILQFGVNTGFNSEKLNITPALMLGLGKRFYLNQSRTMQVVVHGYRWFGGQVTHSPCLDTFERKYYCGNLTAWSDFTWDSQPQSYGAYLVFSHLIND
jgi:hypothetical protein